MSVQPRRVAGRPACGDGRGRSPSLPPDEVLVAGLRTGDEEIFAGVLDAWTPVMLRVARARVSSDEAAAEVVRETWLAVIDGVDRFRGRSALRSWVFRILDKIARSRAARERRLAACGCLHAVDCGGPTVEPGRFRDASCPDAGRWTEPPLPWNVADMSGADEGLQTVVDDALRKLPPRQRVVVELRDVYGVGWDEVCALLEVTPAHQRMLLHRGRAAVLARVDEFVARRREPEREEEAS
jgi:RNA polymerase sigma-70 factor (ECF subfamily)